MSLPLVNPLLLNSIPDPVIIIDRSQNLVTLANSQFIKLTAFTQAELSGIPVAEIVPEYEGLDIFPGVDYQVKLTRRSRSEIDVSMVGAGVDGSGQWLLLSFKPVQAAAVEQTHHEVVGLMQKLAGLLDEEDFQQAMKDAARLTASICGAGYSAIYLAQSDQPRLRLAASFENYPAQTADEHGHPLFLPDLPASDLARLNDTAIWMPGRRLQTDLYKAARVADVAYLASTPIGFPSNPDELSEPGKDLKKGSVGLVIVADMSKQPAENLSDFIRLIGAQIGILYNHQIKLEEQRSQIILQAKQLILRNGLMEHQKEGVLVVSGDLHVMEINPAAEWMLEYTPSEVIGQPVQNVLIGTKSLLPALNDALAGVPTHNLTDVTLHRRSGQSFPAQLRIIPAQNTQTGFGLAGVLVFISDVSEREQIQERTQQLEHRALLGEVIAVFAHEVRNPINNIATGLQLMETWIRPPGQELQGGAISPEEKQSQLVQRMLGDCQRLDHLMESVLQFSRPIEPKLEAMDICAFLQRFLDRWRPRLSRGNVTPYLSAEAELPKIMGDPRTLEQVFTNLISNAVHAMAETGGTLAIRLSRNCTISNLKQVEITVSDTGPGIPEEFLVRLFEPFATTNPFGTGLGLAITKRIITAHRGSITPESFPGGTVFHILLPAAEEE